VVADLVLPPHATVMGFDFGARRIGVATGNLLLAHATPLTTIHAETNADRLAAVSVLFAEWQPQQFVIGQPAHPDGAPHEIAHLAKKFGNRLHENFRIPVAYVDETLSSAAAASALAERGVSGRRQQASIDAEAAAVILQAWFNDHRISHAA